MENDSFSKVRLESSLYSSKKGLGILSAVFFGGVLLCGLLGLSGPTVYDKKNYVLPTGSLSVTWTGSISNMEPWHQRLFLQMRLLNPAPKGATISYYQNYTVSTWGRDKAIEDECPSGCVDCDIDKASSKECNQLATRDSHRTINCVAGEMWCGWTTLLTQSFVQYSTYDMRVDMQQPTAFAGQDKFVLEFEIVFIEKPFTRWEMTWFYTLCTLTVCFMFLPKIGFFTEMLKLPQNMWSRQQMWVGILLVALLFFNNVFFAAQILSPAPRFFFDLYVILLASFLCLMLVFWLDMFSDMANGEMQGTDAAQLWQRSRRKAFKEYAPKIVLITLVWLTTILIYIYVRVKQEGDPTNATVSDLSSYTGVKVLGIVLAAVYFGWLLVHLVGTFRHIARLLPAYRFVMGITLFTVFGTVLGMATGTLSPSQSKAWPLAAFSGLYNMYVLMLAWCYTPKGNEYGGVSTGDGNMELQDSYADAN